MSRPAGERRSHSSLPITSDAMTPTSPAQTAIIKRYKDPASLLAAFNPDLQVYHTRDRRQAYMGSAPSLGLVSKAFAAGTAKSWVMAQLWNLAEFCGCKQKLSKTQLLELSMLICIRYGYMKLTELMDFFLRFKLGEYGKFYGAVDPQVITCALRQFADDRLYTIAHYQRLEREKQQTLSSQHKKWKTDYERSAKKLKFYSHNFRSPDFTYEEFAEIWWLFNMGYDRPDSIYID